MKLIHPFDVAYILPPFTVNAFTEGHLTRLGNNHHSCISYTAGYTATISDLVS